MGRPRKNPAPTAEPFALHYRTDGDTWRVWRSDWFGDQFEVLEGEQIFHLQQLAKRLSIPLIDHSNED